MIINRGQQGRDLSRQTRYHFQNSRRMEGNTTLHLVVINKAPKHGNGEKGVRTNKCEKKRDLAGDSTMEDKDEGTVLHTSETRKHAV